MITTKSEKIDIDDDVYNVKLKNHQRGLVYKALVVDNMCRGKADSCYGLFTDPPGTGKTFVILSLIDLIMKIENNMKHIFLIVVPNQIIKQWTDAISFFYKDNYKVLELIDNDTINRLYRDVSILCQYNIFITTPIMYISLVQSFNNTNFVFRSVFFDEIDIYQKNLSGRIKSMMCWFISASLRRLINNDMTTLGAYVINTYVLLNNECCCDPLYVKKCMKVAKPELHNFVCYDIYIDEIFYRIYYKNRILMNGINSMNYSVLSRECGNVIAKNSKELLSLYYGNLMSMIESKNKDIEDNTKNMRNMNQYDKNKQMEVVGKMMEEKRFMENAKKIIKEQCFINKICIKCFQALRILKNDDCYAQATYYKTPCMNVICSACMMDILEKKYENEYDSKKIIIECEECKSHRKEECESEVCEVLCDEYYNWDKMYILNEILEACGKKIILYNSSRHVIIDFLTKYYSESDKSFIELNGGNINDLGEVIDKFKNYANISLLFINDITLSNGLNLEFVDDVILTEMLEVSLWDQLIGRALRFPRNKLLTIYQLEYKNEHKK